jgi:hypothetical protein
MKRRFMVGGLFFRAGKAHLSENNTGSAHASLDWALLRKSHCTTFVADSTSWVP